MSRLENRVLVVIGAASGIGAATSRLAAREGASLVLADISETGIHSLCTELAGSETEVTEVNTDVRRPESVAELVFSALTAHPRVDAVINCAGIVCPGQIGTLAIETVRRQIDVNLLGTVLVTQAFLPHFRAQGGGHFLHLSSLGGIAPMPGEAVYSATKYAIRGFCLALDLELRGSGIRVSAICPDSVDTPQLEIEASEDGSSLSFGGSVLEPATVGQAIIATILRPEREVLVPRLRGSLTKLANLSPRLMASLYPLLDRMGQRARAEFLQELQERRTS